MYANATEINEMERIAALLDRLDPALREPCGVEGCVHRYQRQAVTPSRPRRRRSRAARARRAPTVSGVA